MPEVSRFYGIVIRMYYREHNPPHFHAIYAGHEVLMSIESLAILRGRLPARALGLVAEWAALHQDELMGRWQGARAGEPLDPIEPLP